MGSNPPLRLLSNMLNKQINEFGQKAHQRTDSEDRSLIYRNWLRTVETGGCWIDIDLIKWKFDTGIPIPVAITDLTRTDREEVGAGYLEAIIDRIFNRDSQGEMLQTLGAHLNVPVYLVLFPKSMAWLWVFGFKTGQWRNFTPLAWSLYLKKL